MTDRVAVIIPSYNHAHLLSMALDSTFAQTVQPHEVIVIDDGSRDDPGEVTRRYPGVKLLRQENQGLAGARNTGVRASDSDKYVFLDADDRMKPDAIERNLALFEARPDCGMVYGSYSYIYSWTGEERLMTVHPPGPDPFGELLRGNHIAMLSAVMFSRQALDKIAAFDPALRACEDYDIYLRLTQQFPVACHPAVISEYVRHDANMSRDSGMMMRTALGVLRNQRRIAEQRPEWLEAFHEGEAFWKRFYADQWVSFVHQTSSAAEALQLLSEAWVILRLSPTALPRAVLRRVRKRRPFRERRRAAA